MFLETCQMKALVKILFTENLQFFDLAIENLFVNMMLKCGIQKPQFFNLAIENLFATIKHNYMPLKSVCQGENAKPS